MNDDMLMWSTWLSMYHFPALVYADEKNLFSCIAKKPSTTEDVASQLQLGMRGSEILLSILTALGFLEKKHDSFFLTDISRTYLLPESKFYWGGILKLKNNSGMLKKLRHAFEFDCQMGKNIDPSISVSKQWQNETLNENFLKDFTAAMHSHSAQSAATLAENFNLRNTRQLLDVGGGSGCFSIALAKANLSLIIQILDLPQVCKVAMDHVLQFKLQNRISVYGTDMFREPWPIGADGVFFSNVFHDWNFSTCLELARKSYEILPHGGHIYLHEILLDNSKSGPLIASGLSMAMLMTTEGKQYTESEFRILLTQAGFTNIHIQKLPNLFSLISAQKK